MPALLIQESSLSTSTVNVSTESDEFSVARVSVSDATSEPWLTLGYDEWMCVLEREVTFDLSDGSSIVTGWRNCILARDASALFTAGTQYIPICVPSFRPDRCLREDQNDDDAAVAARLQKLHAASSEMIICIICAQNRVAPRKGE